MAGPLAGGATTFIMSTSLIAFLTLLEKRVQPLLPTGRTWRFQRLIDFRAGQAVLQLWEDPDNSLTGQVELREARHEEGDAPAIGRAIVQERGAARLIAQALPGERQRAYRRRREQRGAQRAERKHLRAGEVRGERLGAEVPAAENHRGQEYQADERAEHR